MPLKVSTLYLSMGLVFANVVCSEESKGEQRKAEETKLLWGDTHLHTNNSLDAFMNGNLSATPADAYRFAQGEPMVHPYTRARVQLETPLDFLVVTDHAEFLGGMKMLYHGETDTSQMSSIEKLELWATANLSRWIIDSGRGPELLTDGVLPAEANPRDVAGQYSEQGYIPPGADTAPSTTWQALNRTADQYNKPGSFTAFSGWEWSSMPGGANLHSVVVTNASAEQGKQFVPFGSVASPFPEDLLAWLEKTEEQTNARFIAIPHNPNVSKGLMFDTLTLKGEPVSEDYSQRRLRYEPIVEMTQIKGDSETHPDLSPDDEFADYEPYETLLIAKSEGYQVQPGDYVRSGLKRGLEIQEEIGINPYKLGMIGSTDSHTGLATAEEPNFWGKFAFDSIPENKGSHGLGSASGSAMSAAGLAAVWATENTRDAILDAMFRREVYATTGPRIVVRFFGGWNFSADDLTDMATNGYAKGVPMGGTLGAAGTAPPSFLIAASQDPKSEKLDRVQVVKGWLDADGESHEKIYNVVWSDGRELIDGKLPVLPKKLPRSVAPL